MFQQDEKVEKFDNDEIFQKKCTKFQKFVIPNREYSNSMIFLQLRQQGCDQNRALTFAKKNYCRYDTTKKIDGPKEFRNIKPLPQQSFLTKAGWLYSRPEFDLGKEFVTNINQIAKESQDDRQLQLHFDIHEARIKQDYKAMVRDMRTYLKDLSDKHSLENFKGKQLVREIKDQSMRMNEMLSQRKFIVSKTNQKLYETGQSIYQQQQEEMKKEKVRIKKSIEDFVQYQPQISVLEELNLFNDIYITQKYNEILTETNQEYLKKMQNADGTKRQRGSELEDSKDGDESQLDHHENSHQFQVNSLLSYQIQTQARARLLQIMEENQRIAPESEGYQIPLSKAQQLQLEEDKIIHQNRAQLLQANLDLANIKGLNQENFLQANYNESKYFMRNNQVDKTSNTKDLNNDMKKKELKTQQLQYMKMQQQIYKQLGYQTCMKIFGHTSSEFLNKPSSFANLPDQYEDDNILNLKRQRQRLIEQYTGDRRALLWERRHAQQESQSKDSSTINFATQRKFFVKQQNLPQLQLPTSSLPQSIGASFNSTARSSHKTHTFHQTTDWAFTKNPIIKRAIKIKDNLNSSKHKYSKTFFEPAKSKPQTPQSLILNNTQQEQPRDDRSERSSKRDDQSSFGRQFSMTSKDSMTSRHIQYQTQQSTFALHFSSQQVDSQQYIGESEKDFSSKRSINLIISPQNSFGDLGTFNEFEEHNQSEDPEDAYIAQHLKQKPRLISMIDKERRNSIGNLRVKLGMSQT